MGKFVLKRIGALIVALFIVGFLACLLVNMIPGDAALMMLGDDASEEQIAALHEKMHLDESVFVQYFYWLKGIFSGTFGYSLQYSMEVGPLMLSRMKLTVYLGLVSLLLSAVLGIFFGVISAVTKDSALDQVISVLANLGVAMPVFWLGILLVYIFGLKLRLLPIANFVPLSEGLAAHLRSIAMPLFVLCTRPVASLTRQTRSSILDVINQDYIRTAQAKGLPARSVFFKHSLKNALIPVLTQFGLQVRNVIGGSVLVETVFNLPGMGRLVISSFLNKDMYVVQGTIVMIALIVSVANMLTDISYGIVNPKIRTKQEG